MGRKSVLVTGSSRGIGRAIATQLAASGWRVAIHYSTRQDEADDLAETLGKSVIGVFGGDLSKPETAKALWNEVQAVEPLTAVVNNAGVYLPHDLLTGSDEDFEENWSRTFSINFDSSLRLTRLAARQFAQAGGGKILNVASRVGFKGESGAALYAASKAAMISITRSLAIELAPKNVQLFGIAPGWVNTAMSRDGMEQRLPAILETLPAGRMASPEDCAQTADFLLSDGATYLTGVVIDINGASYFH